MPTLSATPGPGFVTVVLDGVTTQAVVTLTRDPSPSTAITVRGTPRILDPGGALVLTDTEHPFDTPITYTATLRDPATNDTLDTLTAISDPVVLPPPGGVVVSNPLTGRSVQVPLWDEYDHESRARRFRYDLAGVDAPIFLTERHAAWSWTVDYATATRSDRDELDGLLRAGQPLLLRTGAACDLMTGWAMPGDITRQRRTRPASDPRRTWTVALDTVDPPDSTVEPVAVTLLDLHEWEPSTLQGIADRPPVTLLALSLAVIDAQ